MKNFNDNLEIEGDLRDEYDAIQEAEKAEVDLTDIVAELIKEIREEQDFNDWCIDQEKD
jgi:hypothetical protein